MQRIGWHPLSRRLLIVCLMLGVALMLVACGGGDSEAKPAAELPIPSEALVVSVVQEIYPESHAGFFGACSLRVMDAACPMTDRLEHRLLDTGISICRCQNSSSTREIAVERYPGGAVAHVTMYGGRITYDLIMVFDGDHLLVDDMTCHGDPRTSIYNDPLGPC